MAKRQSIDYLQILRKLQHAGIRGSRPVNATPVRTEGLPTLEARLQKIFNFINTPSKSATDMLFFVMYDIESDKVRYNVVKYLERQGCMRIQKSIFLASLSVEKYDAIRNDLAEVQSLYDNHDSIIVCPVSTDMLQSMSVIGKTINTDVIIKNKHTLFF